MSIYEFLQKENPGLLEKFLRSKGCITTHNRQPQGDTCFILFGERNAGKKHVLSKMAINYILDREYKKAKQVLDELMEVE